MDVRIHQRMPRSRRGFTLIESAVVTIIIGVGVVGLVQLLAAGSMANGASTELTTATELANNINEMMQGADYSTLHSTYDNKTYSPPRDALGDSLSQFSGWTQSIDVQYVDPNLITSAVPDTQYEVTSRVTVTVSHNGKSILTEKWLVVAPS